MRKIILILILSFLFVGCEVDPDATNPADVTKEETQTTVMQTMPIEEECTPWQVYAASRELTNGLDNKEIQSMIYTKQGDKKDNQSINLNIKYYGTKSTKPGIHANGSVKAKNKVIPLEMYYKDGNMYSFSGSGKDKEALSFESAASKIDSTRNFVNQLVYSYITSIDMEENVDGTKLINFKFIGKINGVESTGQAEIVIDNNGYITSEGYSLSSTPEDTSKIVRQSVEITLINYNESVSPIEYPDLSGF